MHRSFPCLQTGSAPSSGSGGNGGGGSASSPIASGPSMPQAAAYFPLTSRNLTSAFPLGERLGMACIACRKRSRKPHC